MGRASRWTKSKTPEEDPYEIDDGVAKSELLLMYSVKPQTARQYLNALRGLVKFLEINEVPFTSYVEKDAAIARYLASR